MIETVHDNFITWEIMKIRITGVFLKQPVDGTSQDRFRDGICRDATYVSESRSERNW